jgi:DNA-binding IclR family transcriptional regulator
MKVNRTVQRALLILDHIALSPKGRTLSELAETLGIPKTSLFDIVSTLEGMNFLRKHEKQYFIGEKSRDVGNAYIRKQDLCDVAAPILTAASESLGTSSSLVLLSRKTLEYCFQYHPQDAVMVARQACPYNHLHASATGKILLAFMPPSRRDSILKEFTYHKFTNRTLDNLDDLTAELEKVRKQGFAIDDREYHYLLQCVAAPIRHRGRVIAAISFSGLNLFNDDPDAMVGNVLATAKEITDSHDRANMFFEQAVEAE